MQRLMKHKRTAIVGATGFTGSELVRLLLGHPDVTVEAITSESKAGQKFSDVHPQFTGLMDMELIPVADLVTEGLDAIFLALPHGISMGYVADLIDTEIPLIDFSGDFRLSDAATYEEWYGKEHTFPAGFERSVYGIPELFREDIPDAQLIANPGCYPTCSILGLAPLLDAGLVERSGLIIDAKSGVTGAGITPKPITHFPHINDNSFAYGLKHHRHTIEIEQTLGRVAGNAVTVQFTPHLLPVDRGIIATIYANPVGTVTDESLVECLQTFYRDSPFVRVRESIPTLKDVRGTNLCDLYATVDTRTNRVIIVSVIDNLVKGAAGQAVQNMNLRLGLAESTGLQLVPLKP